jgi:sugar fermentation stimulation protein A
MSKGVYCLIINLPKDKTIKIGKLGNILFKKGYYCYVGSALNNLEKRILRHKSKNKKIRWHIDYFLKYGKITGTIEIKTTKKLECRLSKKVNKLSDTIILKFGCSDCRCSSHLYYFNKNPSNILKNTFK